VRDDGGSAAEPVHVIPLVDDRREHLVELRIPAPRSTGQLSA
jgi:hypothetical protein